PHIPSRKAQRRGLPCPRSPSYNAIILHHHAGIARDTMTRLPAQLRDAIAHYHDLCHAPGLAQDSWNVILPGMARRDLVFGDRPLCNVLRPLLHDSLSWHYLTDRTAIILGALRKL